jgi:hypothetical protein
MRDLYEKALTEFPGSVLATTAIRMVASLTPKEEANQPLQRNAGISTSPSAGSEPRRG